MAVEKSNKHSYYVACSIGKGKTLYLHQFLMQPPAGYDVHHKDENTRNNKRSNLIVENSIIHRTWHLNKRRADKEKQKLQMMPKK